VSIDLPPEHQGSLCLLCDVFGEAEAAQLYDRDIGPVCHPFFSHALRATTELRWASLVPLPPKTPTRKANK
jgi:hypothetical protein